MGGWQEVGWPGGRGDDAGFSTGGYQVRESECMREKSRERVRERATEGQCRGKGKERMPGERGRRCVRVAA